MKIVRVVLTIVVVASLTLTATPPASAAVLPTGPDSELRVTYSTRGAYTVTGSNTLGDDLRFCPAGGDDMWTITEAGPNGPITHVLPVAVASIRFHLGGGPNQFASDGWSCGAPSTDPYDNTLSSFSLFGSFPGWPTETVVGNLAVTRNMTIRAGHDSDRIQLVDSTIGGNLSIALNGGPLDAAILRRNVVERLLNVSGGTGENHLNLIDGDYERFRYTGHSQKDVVTTYNARLGRNPSISTGNSADEIAISGTDVGTLASGRLSVRTGRGSDVLRLQSLGTQVTTARAFSVNANMSLGDDTVLFRQVGIVPGDRLDGSANQDTIGACGQSGGTVLRFEASNTTGGCSGSDDLPITGTAVPELAAFDQVMLDYMTARDIEAGVLAIMKDGDVVFERGYGWQDEANTTPLQPDALLRVASVTKPITAAAIQKLISNGDLAASDRVFCLDATSPPCVLTLTPFGQPDSRLRTVTIQHLLDHRGGWDRAVSYDPMFRARDIADALDVESPPSQQDIARYVMGQPLDFTPNARRAYSNFGYLLLGLVVEEVTGQDFTTYVQTQVFNPLGVATSEVQLGATYPEDRNPREPWYDGGRWPTDVSPPHGLVSWADGGWHLEAFEAHGGLITTSRALLEFAQGYWAPGFPRVGNGQNWYATGSLDGTYSLLRWRPDGVNIAFIVNSRRGSTDGQPIEDQLDAVADSILVWP